METKSYFIAAVLFVLLIICSFIPVTNKRQIIIKAPLYDVAKQINDLHNWKQWNTDLKTGDIKISGSYNADQAAISSNKISYSLHHISPINISLTRTADRATTSSEISLAPSTNDSTTIVAWTETVTLFEVVKRSITLVNSRQVNLANLKKLMEDVNHKYGFFIQLVPVKDTLILTAKTSAIENRSSHEAAYLYDMLQSFINEHNIPSEKKYFYSTILSTGEIAVGVPVYKPIKDSAYIKCLQLPRNGRLVEGNYQGKLSDKRSIYNALNNFMLDHHFKQIAQPLEQYNVADTVLDNNKDVNLKIYYPVF